MEKLTNEYYAHKIINGEERYLSELYMNNVKFIALIAHRYYTRNQDLCISAGVTEEDLKQEGYFAVLSAVDAYRDKGIDQGHKFISYLRFPLLHRFNNLSRQKTAKGRGEPLNRSISYDQPIGSDEDSLLIVDMIADEASSVPYENVVQKIYLKNLKIAMDEALQKKLSDQEREVIRGRYYDERTLKEISEDCGLSIERVRQIEIASLRRLRRAASLQTYLNELREEYAYRFIGAETFNRTRTNTTENAALKMIMKMRGYKNEK